MIQHIASWPKSNVIKIPGEHTARYAKVIGCDCSNTLPPREWCLFCTSRGQDGTYFRVYSDISRSLKALAKELNVPVIALSQLSRAVEARKPPIPMLADLRESGAIEQDADVVMFIYREDVYDSNSERKGIADIIISKHRNGPIGKKELMFQDRFAKFESLDLRES